MKNIVYAFTNAAMPGLIKIGVTNDIDKHLADLSDLSSPTSVPLPFECEYAAEVEDGLKVGKKIQQILDKERVVPNRDFFNMKAHCIVAMLEFLHDSKKTVIDITDIIDIKLHDITVSKSKHTFGKTGAVKGCRSRSSNFSFPLVGIRAGEELVYKYDATKICKVVDDRHVAYGGKKDYTLSGLAGKFLQEQGKNIGRGVNGTLYFQYNNELLNVRRLWMEAAVVANMPKPVVPISVSIAPSDIITPPPIK